MPYLRKTLVQVSLAAVLAMLGGMVAPAAAADEPPEWRLIDITDREATFCVITNSIQPAVVLIEDPSDTRFRWAARGQTGSLRFKFMMAAAHRFETGKFLLAIQFLTPDGLRNPQGMNLISGGSLPPIDDGACPSDYDQTLEARFNNDRDKVQIWYAAPPGP
ncbi:MAG: hypothetical protein R3322_23690 [Kiloniellales bacterium]|jgi:hypothetical protein|nr:hypothetical protein [Kiloniellales bacterium]